MWKGKYLNSLLKEGFLMHKCPNSCSSSFLINTFKFVAGTAGGYLTTDKSLKLTFYILFSSGKNTEIREGPQVTFKKKGLTRCLKLTTGGNALDKVWVMYTFDLVPMCDYLVATPYYF